MTDDRTNPRQVYETGHALVISFPKTWADEHGIEKGNRYVLEPREHGWVATQVVNQLAKDE